MPYGDPTSLGARTRYRMQRQLRRLRQRIAPASPPFARLQAEALASRADIGDPRTFHEDDYGSGAFGHWILDEVGLPAYRYEMNQYQDDRATYPVSSGAFRRDHWHQVGNLRLNALASNDGTVQVFTADRGPMFLNQFSYGGRMSWLGAAWEVLTTLALALPRMVTRMLVPGREPGAIVRLRSALGAPGAHRRDDQQHAYSGGFAYIYDGREVWSTAYRYAPALRAEMERVFGMGYYKTVVTHRAVRVTRRVYAPAGDVPALLVDVELTNTGDISVDLMYYEYWDINIQQLPFQPFRSGALGIVGDAERRAINQDFTPCIAWDAHARALRFHLRPPQGAPSADIPNDISWLPPDIFLADLSGTPSAWHFDKSRFFGAGGASKPDGVGQAGETETTHTSDVIMPYCMVLRRDVALPAGQSVRLRFAFGTLDPDESFDCSQPDPAVRMPPDWEALFQGRFRLDNPDFNPFQAMVADWKSNLTYFTIGSGPHLQREMAWHAYYLQSSTVYHRYFENRFVPQGAVYLYLQGIDGVPRDFSVFAMPLVYLNPALARDVLRSIMKMTDGQSGQMAYSYTGNGALTGALVHNTPSDLDLYFLLALTEYIAATGDVDFLHEEVPFYRGLNQPQDRTVLDHIRVAFDHLMRDVGIGESDLLRVRDGDWSDDVVLTNTFPIAPFSFSSRRLTIEQGESVPNSLMALYVLPRAANLLAGVDSHVAQALAEHMRAELATALPRLRHGIRAQWNGRFFARAVLRQFWNNKRVLHSNLLDLEAQVWAFISEFEPEPGLLEKLKNAVYDQRDAPSPIGALMANGAVWPAMSQLLTWGYTLRYPQLAWRSFVNHTFANKAEVYSDTWLNIWSGPDAVNGPRIADPGGTYDAFPVTPATDFPVMNNNQHALALLALLRICGVEPSEAGDGLRITPRVLARYALSLPLLSLDVSPERIQGEYRAHNRGTRVLYVRLPSPVGAVKVTINDQVASPKRDADGYVKLALPGFAVGDVIEFEVCAV